MGGLRPPQPPRSPPLLFFFFLIIIIIQGFKYAPIWIIIFSTPLTRQLFLDFVTHDLLVMLGMLVGHAGDVENAAGDADGLAQNTSISREHTVTYDILLARTKDKKKVPE